MAATGILGDDRIPMLEAFGVKTGLSMDVVVAGRVIQGVAESLRTWEVFFWTAR